MATVLNRTTRQLIQSANTVDYPIASWIINPDLSAVQGQPVKYWVITGDTVSLMDAATQAATDAAILSASRDATTTVMDTVEDYARAFALVVLDEFNRHTNVEAAIFAAAAAATSLANFQARMAAITPVPTRTIDDLKTGVRSKLGS